MSFSLKKSKIWLCIFMVLNQVNVSAQNGDFLRKENIDSFGVIADKKGMLQASKDSANAFYDEKYRRFTHTAFAELFSFSEGLTINYKLDFNINKKHHIGWRTGLMVIPLGEKKIKRAERNIFKPPWDISTEFVYSYGKRFRPFVGVGCIYSYGLISNPDLSKYKNDFNSSLLYSIKSGIEMCFYRQHLYIRLSMAYMNRFMEFNKNPSNYPGVGDGGWLDRARFQRTLPGFGVGYNF